MIQIRRISLAIAVVAAMAAAYGLGRYNSHSQTDGKKGRQVLYYVDPMHPAYKSDKPGIAPDCGMQLEPVYAENLGNASPSSSLTQLPPGAVSIDGATQRLLGIRLAEVEKSTGIRTLRVVGRVVPEDTRIYRLNSGVDGFIRETYDDSVGIQVKKNQKLATYYSPEFLSVASGFLAATERVPGATGGDGSRTVPFPGAVNKQGVSSLQGYTDRLRNLGMSDLQIKQISDTRQLPENVDVVAPADGFILARNVSAGLHFDHNMEFYRVADLGRVWVVAEVDEQEAATLRPGGMAKVTLSGEARQLPARITDSLPQSEAGGGTVKLRLEVENPGFKLRPEMLVDVELPVHLPAGITVPVDALVDSGARRRVYVEHGEGVFEPRDVETGWRYGEQVEIRKGVQPGERVIVSATFLVDSESRLKSAASSAAAPAPAHTADGAAAESGHRAVAKTVIDPTCGMAVDAAKSAESGNKLTYHGATYYFCSQKCKEKFQNKSALTASKQASGR
ncbi:MAG: efflux RND transporter periplasmic adaptor subunit [Candidatus Acidiferrum sp.]